MYSSLIFGPHLANQATTLLVCKTNLTKTIIQIILFLL